MEGEGETIAFVDCSAGVAGDMLLGALIDAGAPLDAIVRGLNSLRGIQGEWGLRTSRAWKGPGRIAGTKVHVDSIYKHRELAPPTAGAASTAVETETHAHDHSHEHAHDHDHSHSHDHGHEHQHHHVDDDKVGVAHDHSHEHAHDHSHSHDHGHGHSHSHDGEPMRNLDDIKELVMSSDLSKWAKTQSIAVFTHLAEAEAHTHGTTLADIHFHEVGAIDSIIDTVGSVLAMDLLGVRKVYSSFLPFSSGTVKCAHGILPVPPPATFRLMIGVPVCPAPKGATGELVTPTGISLVKALTSGYGEPPAFVPTHTGVGAGTKDFPHHANIVRVAIGKSVERSAVSKPFVPSGTSVVASAQGDQQQLPYDEEEVVVLEMNLDDLNPQAIGYVFDKLLVKGENGDSGCALDIWTQPIQMKKNRPAVCLRKTLQRVFLRREFISICAFERSVSVKLGYYGDKIINVYPEYEQCKEIARNQCIPLLHVIHQVQSLAFAFLASQ
uniref:Nickel insertion protein n=1 Tax=Globisporangium ultimum (strain ATCC 200006 / CBS 805.95 / DAOM BR144) TaxID=431595 RepID=K3WI47_GLOUD